MTPYERTHTVTTTGGDEIVVVSFPGRIEITRLAVVRIGGGAIAADFYSRAFTSAATTITRIINDGNGKCLIHLRSSLALAVGDVVTVASSSVGGYNTSHRITARQSDKAYVTDVAYSANAAGGTLTLAIPAEEQPLYKVTAQLTGTAVAESSTHFDYVNRDPPSQAPNSITQHRRIYVKLATADTYRIVIKGVEDIG